MFGRRNLILLNAAFLLLLVTVIDASILGGGMQDDSKVGRKNVEAIEENQWPLAVLDSPEPSESAERDKRRAKSRKHNKSLLGLKGAAQSPPPAGRVTLVTDWEVGLPALPAEQSSAVITGEVLSARAYVSTDRSGVYSEFTILVNEVLKNDERAPLAPGGLISADREGGRVRIRPGQTVLFTIKGQRMPLAGRQYVLFLSEDGPPGSNYRIVTGYEVREGRVFPLDDVKGHPFETFTGKEAEGVLRMIRGSRANRHKEITNPGGR
jgi:hypothetical protein